MADLTDFQNKPTASLDDFKQDIDKSVPVSNGPSNANLAAHAVMVSGDPQAVKDNYNSINAELSTEGKSALASKLLDSVKNQTFTEAKSSLSNILTDPSISDDQKRQAAINVYDKENSIYSVSNIVSSQAVAQPMTNEPKEVDLQRTDIVGPAIDEMNKIKAAQQMMLNREVLKTNPTMMQHVNDIAQMMAPFSQQSMSSGINSAANGGSLKERVFAFLAKGSSKVELRDMLKSTRPEDRLALTQKLIDTVNDHSNIVMNDTNQYAKVDYLRTMLQDGYYDNEDKWVDNAMGVLDYIGVGEAASTLFKGANAAKSAGEAARAEKAFVDSYTSNVSKDMVRSDVQPVTVSQNLKDTNPEKARAVHEVAASDETGQAAQALYGASREEAVAHDLAPEIAKDDGSVKNKTATPDSINNNNITPDPAVADFVNNNGAIYYTRAEKASARANVVNDFQHAFDMTDRKEMFQVLSFDKADKSSGVKIKAVYGPQQGGYSNPLDAIELAKWGLRKHGIDDSNITLLKRVNGDYVPVDPKTIDPNDGRPNESVNPFTNSKIKDVVYHGTNKNFDGPFDTSKSKDAGTWFTPNKAATKMYGDKTIPANVNLENPYEAKVGESRHDAIEKAMDGGHDGIIVRDENGEVSTISVFDGKNIHRLSNTPDPGFAKVSSDEEIKALHDKGHYHEVEVKGGSKIRLVGVDHGGDVREVVAFNENGERIGSVLYGTSDIRTDNPNVKVDPKWQRKGVASSMYDYAEKHGAKFPEANTQKNYRSKDGQAFRDSIEKKRISGGGNNGANGGGNGDYLIQVDYDHDMIPGDVGEWSNLTVKRNPFDMLPPITQGRSGSLNRHVFDIASMLDPTITKGAAVQIDKASGLEKRLLDSADRFAKEFKNSSPELQQKMVHTITEANAKGLDMDYHRLVGQGYTPQEIDTLKAWRDYWDTQWWLENRDMSRTLSTKGYMQYIDPVNDTNLFARPIGRAQVKGSVKAYNSATGDIEFIKADELDALYNAGGTVAHLRQPIHTADDAAEFIVSPEKAGGGYLRAINNDTPVLAYRKGYYHVRYKDPHFIIKKVKSASGKDLYQKAVATAPGVKEAKLMVNRLQATDGGEYFYRSDKNSPNYSKSDGDWDLHVTHGRSAQRIRGQRLEDATSTAVDPGMGHIVSPLEAMINSARSISRRVSTRDYIEATKARAIEQYGDVLPTGKFGQKVIPGNRKEIGFQGDKKENLKQLADARSTMEYIRYMENGYINGLDDSIKAGLNSISNILGEHGLDKAEKATHWLAGSKGPTGLAKSTAFTLYLALNPFRQFIVQAHQAVQLMALNPKWAASGLGVRESAYIFARQAGMQTNSLMAKYVGSSEKELNDMYKAFERSGLSATIDKQNLVRDNMLDITDQFTQPNFKSLSPFKKVLSLPGKVTTGARKIGFDAGENFNIVTAFLAHRDLAKQAGKDLTSPEVMDQVAADARNFTYNMNSAGDMPYNQNALGTILQFMQQGHKAVLTMTTNRGITPAMRARLVAFNALMYGLPAGLAYTVFADYMPKSQDGKDVVSNGLEGTIFNKLLTMATGEKTRIDFSGVSPVNMYGYYDFIHSLFSTDVGTIVSSTPSGQLFFGGNSRLTKFARTAAQYFNLVDNYGDPVEFSQVATDFAKLSSGMSNAYKAAYMMKYRQKISSGGNVSDGKVTSAEAVAQFFGFQTLDETTKYAMSNYLYNKSKAHDDDVLTWYKNYKADITRDGMKPEEIDYVQKTYTEAFRVWGNDDYRAKQLIERQLMGDIENGDDRMYKQVLNSIGVLNPQEFRRVVENSPDMSDDDKKRLNDLQDYIEQYKEPN